MRRDNEVVEKAHGYSIQKTPNDDYMAVFPTKLFSGLKWLTGYATAEAAAAAAKAALREHQQLRDTTRRNAAASSDKQPALPAAAAQQPLAAAHEEQHILQQQVQMQTKRKKRQMRRGEQYKGKRQRKQHSLLRQSSTLMWEVQQLRDAERDGKDSQGALGAQLLLTSLAGNLSAGQQLQLQKQVQKLQLQLQREKQLQLQQMQQQQQQAMQEVNKRHQAQLAVLLGERQQLHQAQQKLHQEVQQLRAQLQMGPGRQWQQLLLQQPLAAAAAAATCAEPAAGPGHVDVSQFVQLTKVYDSSLPANLFVRLDQPVADGATAAVFPGVLVFSNGEPLLSTNGLSTEPVKVAVRVFNAPARRPQELLQLAKHELTVLQVLQGHFATVLLVGEGVLQVPAAAAAGSSAAAAGPSQTVQCIVEELAICSVSKRLELLGPLPEKEVQKHTYYLAHLLATMHSGSLQLKTASGSSVPVCIVNRDIKPDNLLVRGDGSIAMADFGFASIQQQQQQQWQVTPPAGQEQGCPDDAASDHEMDYAAAILCVAGTAAAAAPAAVLGGPGAMHSLVGTAHYMPPELAEAALADRVRLNARKCPGSHGAAASGIGDAADRFRYDASVDTYALGVSVMEMLVGKLQYMDSAGLGYDALQVQDERLAAFVNDDDNVLQRLLPQAVYTGVRVSQAAREFVGCCCGVGAGRNAAAAKGQAKRLTAAQLMQLPWMQAIQLSVEQG